ncbi:MAG: glycosyltransferase family 39 protein [Saprospiraceae bacterium]|nr:glycosyltransferase family 39 protein [Saprospiraceae bacterium]
MKLKPKKILILLGLLLLLVTTICHAPIFTQDLAGIHVWRQSQTQLNIINFYRYDFNILNPRHHALNINAGNTILRYEFPLMQWMIALNHKLFGPHIAVTRISLFLLSIITLLGVFQLLLTLFKHTWSAFGNLGICLSDLYSSYYSINPLPDNFALLHTIWFLFFFFRYIQSKSVLDLVCSALFISLAALSKLPFVLAGVVAAFYVLTNSWTANRKQL